MGFFEELARVIKKFGKRRPLTPDTQLTENFKLGEFVTNDDRKTQVPLQFVDNVKELAKNLQVIRDHVGTSIKVFSGYRTPEHNAAIGGVKNSKHMVAKAADLKSLCSTAKLHELILLLIDEGKIKEGGVGHYPGRFVHYDIRGTRARWTGKGR